MLLPCPLLSIKLLSCPWLLNMLLSRFALSMSFHALRCQCAATHCVIASEAKQPNLNHQWPEPVQVGLLRRYAPRNDGVVTDFGNDGVITDLDNDDLLLFCWNNIFL